MSDLTAQAWSEQTIARLHALEARCSDEDLFCVGYLIPPVELVEVEYGNDVGSAQQWQSRLATFVESCLSKDRVGEGDASRIREIVSDL